MNSNGCNSTHFLYLQTTDLLTPAHDVVIELVGMLFQDMGIPCYLGGMSRGMLGRDNPLQVRQKRRDALREADVIVLAGRDGSDL